VKSRWDEAQADKLSGDPLGLRVYTSRLLGADESLVMHGGGNTSVKINEPDFFGDPTDVLYIKGSGWDLRTIEKPGFAPLRLEPTRRLATLETLSDVDMARLLRSFLLDPSAPSPSVEAILHAIIPSAFVDHTHTDSVVTLSNTPDGDRLIGELYPDCLVLPYVMPGFVLSRQVYDAIREVDPDSVAGIVLLHHGVFTFDDDARRSYEKMIELVDRADRYISDRVGPASYAESTGEADPVSLARIRRAVSLAHGGPQLAMLDRASDARGFAARGDIEQIAGRGPITPDHVIRTKRTPVVIPEDPGEDIPAIGAFVADYERYFHEHAGDGHTMLNPAPRAGVWRGRGAIAFGSSVKECGIVADIARHTRWAIQTAEALGGWQTLSEREIFELEYWSLEQAKLARRGGVPPAHQGKVALVTGANSGIGLATCRVLADEGAAVVGIDIAEAVSETLGRFGQTGVACDVTDAGAVRAAIEQTVLRFGGLDILVCNAGVFRSGERLESQTTETWDLSLSVNLTAAQRLLTAAIPYLELGLEPSVLVVGSRNVPAPGPGAAAYSVSKAGLTQLARVAALELAPKGVRVNVVHPDAVFDTALWSEEALERSAARYGMTIEEYRSKSLLGKEVRSTEVASVLSALAGKAFASTTGAQIPVDGGDARVV
jgi:rhamnose utilization protein RhaD (predicted bifunctional aldolase and dehydrogenase)/NAD(P)-dependent dehydrogenase (short-subunit alcohol dehydrogenase family)